MANPFLFTEEEMAEEVPSQETFANPFLMEDTGEAEDDAVGAPSDNPFFDQQVSNPFADFQQPAEEVTAAPGEDAINTSFFDTTINDAEDIAVPPVQINVGGGGGIGDFYSSEDELEKTRKGAPPPRPGPPIAAQHLISTVAGQLDLASHDLLGRIPVTRTPSPVSMRDLHSPSPPPEENLLMDDQMPEDEQVIPAELPKATPARPPPRPQPPPKPEPPQQVVPQHQEPASQEPDIMDMFGVEETQVPSRPPPPKTNEDILSLFSAPAEQEEVQLTDLLSEDIPVYTPAPVVVEEPVALPPSAPVVETVVEQMQIEQQPIPEAIPQPELVIPVHPVIPANSPFASEPDDEFDQQPFMASPPQVTPAAVEVQPVVQEKVISPVSNPFADLPPAVAAAPVQPPARPAPPPRPAVPPPSAAVPKPLPKVEPMPVYVPPVVAPAPVAIPMPVYVPPVVVPAPVAAPMPVYVPPVAVPAPAVIPSAFASDPDDEFDAFSAKFNSAQKVEKTNVFLDDPATDGKKDT